MVNQKGRVELKLRNIYFEEAGCRCGCGLMPSTTILIALQAFIYLLERVLGVQVRAIITSMARCQSHNAHEGGVADSRHTVGRAIGDGRPDAADTKMQMFVGGAWIDIEPETVARYALKSGLFGGVGWERYLTDRKTPTGKVMPASRIVHLDCRPGPTVTW